MNAFIGMPILLHRHINPEAQPLAGHIACVESESRVAVACFNEFGSPYSQTGVLFCPGETAPSNQDWVEPNHEVLQQLAAVRVTGGQSHPPPFGQEYSGSGAMNLSAGQATAVQLQQDTSASIFKTGPAPEVKGA